MADLLQGIAAIQRTRRCAREARKRWPAWSRRALHCALVLTVLAGLPSRTVDEDHRGLASMGMATALAEPAKLDDGFRIGISYYGALAMDWDSIVKDDFCTLVDKDYSVVRVWATWCGPDCTTGSLVNSSGNMKTDQKARLKKLLDFAKSKNMIIDITFEPAQFVAIVGGTPSFQSYNNAVNNVAAWVNGQGYAANVVIDVCNECIAPGLKDPSDTVNYVKLENTELDKFKYEKDKPYAQPPTDWKTPLRDMIKLVRAQNITAFFSVLAFYESATTRAKDQEAVLRAQDFYDHVYDGGFAGSPLAPHFGRKPCDKWDDWTDERIADLYTGTSVDKYPLYLQEENRRGSKQGCCGGAQPSDAFKKKPCSDSCTSDGDIGEKSFYAAAKLARDNPTKKAWAWVFHTDAGFACGGKPFFDANRLDSIERCVVCNLKNKVVIDKTPGDCSPSTNRCPASMQCEP